MRRDNRLVTALVACAIAVVLTSAGEGQVPDRSRPPVPGPAPSLRLPPIQKRALGNGLPVWIVELHEVPVVQVNLVVRTGSAADPAQKFGVASLTAALLDEGAGNRSALEIADSIDYLGGELSTSSSFDASVVRLHVPVARLPGALPIVADVTLRPTFPEKELERIRRERLTSLIQARDDPQSIVSAAFPRLLYGPTHRYGTSTIGTPPALRAITVQDLRAFHGTHYHSGNSALIVAGDVTPDPILPLLEAAFGSWKTPNQPVKPSQIENAPQVTRRQVYLVDKPGAAQSQIRIGWIGVPRSTPDYFGIQVLNTILGGSFTSRLNQNLREEHGYAYGAFSAFEMRAAAGPFFAAASVQTDKTAEAIKEFFNELNGMLKPVSGEELAKAKNYRALRYPRSFETTRDLADQLVDMIVYSLPEDFFSTYISRIQAVTAADVLRVAKSYIQPERFVVVIVGDRKAIESSLGPLNLGALTLVALDDVMN